MNEFLAADPARLGRPDVSPSSDAVDEELEAVAEPLGGIGGKAVAASLFSIRPQSAARWRSGTTNRHRPHE